MNYQLQLEKEQLENDILVYKSQIESLSERSKSLETQFMKYYNQFDDIANTRAELKILKEYVQIVSFLAKHRIYSCFEKRTIRCNKIGENSLNWSLKGSRQYIQT